MTLNPYARNTDPDTSHEAAEALEIAGFWRKIVQLLTDSDRPEGWTAYEIDQALPGQLGLCPWHRVSDVRRQGWVAWASDEEGRKIKRPGESNRRQGASRVTPEGRIWLQNPVALDQGQKGRPPVPAVNVRREQILRSLLGDGPQTGKALSLRLGLDVVIVHQDLNLLAGRGQVYSQGSPMIWRAVIS